MAKLTQVYACSNCGAQFPKWQGRCTECGQWGTVAFEAAPRKRISRAQAGSVVTLDTDSRGLGADHRIPSGMLEWDRVLGGGIVPGSLILLGGDPGIGKSTLALQLAAQLSSNQNVLYVSGEESAEQVGLRLKRLQVKQKKLAFLAETDLDVVLATLEETKPQLAVIDSVQTLATDDVPSEAGSVPQVRTATVRLLDVAKANRIALVLVGHVTKEGAMAGPKALEHLVDVVLYLEGDRYHAFRILRGVKNRFGSTNEVGVFDMRNDGLREVANPSEVFLAERQTGPGSAVTSVVEGSRAFLVEIQALVNPTVFGMPRRTTSGLDINRLQLLLAVLQKRAGLKLGTHDVYVNVVGGFRVTEPAADLAAALAIASIVSGQAIPGKLVAIGEVGLGGEVRSVSNLERRLKEAKQLGFTEVVLSNQGKVEAPAGVQVLRVGTVKDAINEVLGRVVERENGS
ncbi:MAG: DNA repair protein RadA [Candidatus Kerfeldbacteria bacterium]|nr:DNA repair protein RadA [Candidatus Kerfeldbacteria bacterium]